MQKVCDIERNVEINTFYSQNEISCKQIREWKKSFFLKEL